MGLILHLSFFTLNFCFQRKILFSWKILEYLEKEKKIFYIILFVNERAFKSLALNILSGLFIPQKKEEKKKNKQTNKQSIRLLTKLKNLHTQNKQIVKM